MGALGGLVRFIRPLSDLVVPLSFNRAGFALNRRGFDEDDIPSDAGRRVALVTGANSGIGFATSRELTRRNFDVWMLCRDSSKGAEAREAILLENPEARVHLAVVDMSSLASVRRFAAEFKPSTVDVLVHNAGVLPDKKTLSDDAVELTFATNVLGPFALTRLLVDKLSRSTDARVIFVASGGLYAQRLDLSLLEIDPPSFDGVVAYANAKRAQVLLAHEFADRLGAHTSITFASMHPGWANTTAVKTSLPKFHALMEKSLRAPDQGADTIVWLAASDKPRGTQGRFWFDRRVTPEYLLPWTHEREWSREDLYELCLKLSDPTGLDAHPHTAREGA